MEMRDQMVHDGHWLFRHRSYIPLIPIAVAVSAVSLWGSEDALPGRVAVAIRMLAIVASLVGFSIRAWAVGCAPRGTSGRNTKGQVASTLNTTGAYSLARHPLYLGNYLMGLGPTLVTFTIWVPAFYSFFFAFYYERIMLAEESFLRDKFGDDFESWAARTPAILPRVHGYTPAALPWSLRNVLRREYNGAYAIVLLFSTFDLLADWIHNRPVGGGAEFPTLAGATVLWLGLRHLKRHTSLLVVEGR